MARFEAAYREVTCANCGREYVCKPTDDYFNATSATNGVCKACRDDPTRGEAKKKNQAAA